jgi:urea transport system permease protein
VLGALIVNYGKTYFTTGMLAPYWLFVLGGMFVLVTLFLPRGIVGTLQHHIGLRRERNAAVQAEEGVGADPDPALLAPAPVKASASRPAPASRPAE